MSSNMHPSVHEFEVIHWRKVCIGEKNVCGTLILSCFGVTMHTWLILVARIAVNFVWSKWRLTMFTNRRTFPFISWASIFGRKVPLGSSVRRMARTCENKYLNEMTYKGSTFLCRLRFSWSVQGFKIAIWEDTQARNLLLKFIFSTLKIAFKLNKKKSIVRYLENGRKYRKIFQIWAEALLLGVL